MIKNEGKEILLSLGHGIGKLRSETIWHPTGMGNESLVNMIELKAMLIYAERKIQQIYDREQYGND